MTTADRVDQTGYRSWAPPAAVSEDEYVGRHRRPSRRALSLHRLFYRARHPAPDR